MSEVAAGTPAADQNGGIVPEFEDLKVVIRTIKLANPDMGIAKVRAHSDPYSAHGSPSSRSCMLFGTIHGI
jgi:hypothetical protein